MPRRRADKVDENQPGIVDDLRKLGYSVEVGHDDLIVGHARRTYWYEVKTVDCLDKHGNIKESSKREDQKRLDREYKGHRRYVTCTEDILEDLTPCIY